MTKNSSSRSGKSASKSNKTSVHSAGMNPAKEKDVAEGPPRSDEASISNFECLESLAAQNESICDTDEIQLEGISEFGLRVPPSDAGELEHLLTDEFATFAEESSEEFALEKLIGADDRRQVDDPTIYPYHCVCYLLIRTKQGRLLSGTGWLVSSNLIITAGHCVYRRDERDFVASVTVFQGGFSDAKSSRSSGKFHVCSSYPDCQTNEMPMFDYGAIVLDNALPDTGTLGVGVYSDESLDNETLNLIGYPTDKPPGTLWYHARPITVSQERTLEYQIDTYPGMSGAPVIDIVKEAGTLKYIVVGIHSGSIHGRPLNQACRIVGQVWENIRNWCD